MDKLELLEAQVSLENAILLKEATDEEKIEAYLKALESLFPFLISRLRSLYDWTISGGVRDAYAEKLFQKFVETNADIKVKALRTTSWFIPSTILYTKGNVGSFPLLLKAFIRSLRQSTTEPFKVTPGNRKVIVDADVNLSGVISYPILYRKLLEEDELGVLLAYSYVNTAAKHTWTKYKQLTKLAKSNEFLEILILVLFMPYLVINNTVASPSVINVFKEAGLGEELASALDKIYGKLTTKGLKANVLVKYKMVTYKMTLLIVRKLANITHVGMSPDAVIDQLRDENNSKIFEIARKLDTIYRRIWPLKDIG